MIIQKGRVAAILREHGLQIQPAAYEAIDRKIAILIAQMAATKASQGIKRLRPEDISLGVTLNPSPTVETAPEPPKDTGNDRPFVCERCTDLEDWSLHAARTTQTITRGQIEDQVRAELIKRGQF